MITTRPATRADFEAFYERPPPMTLRGIVAESTLGEIIGFGGYHLEGGAIQVVTDNRDEMTKRDRIRSARAVMKLIIGLGVDAYAISGPDGDTVLKHYGFKPWGQFWRRAST